jgi:drug/metabolite transporter (DMT)-like permease
VYYLFTKLRLPLHTIMSKATAAKGENIFDTTTYLLFGFLVLLWGAAYFFMKEALHAYPPLHTALLRISIAAIAMLPLAIKHIKHVDKAKLPVIFLSGFLGNGIPAVLYMYAMQKVDSNVAGILNALTPIWVLVIGYLFYRKKVSALKTIGILVGFAGICILFLNKGSNNETSIFHAMLVLGATCLYGFNLNVLEHHLHDVPSRYIGSISLLVVGLLYGIILLIGVQGESIFTLPLLRTEMIYIIILGVVGTAFSNILFFKLIKRSNANFASMVTYIMPIVSIIIGYFANEVIAWQSLVCFAFILLGVYLVKFAK